MNLNHKITIDLFEVFKTGKFDFIQVGKDKNWILNNFPKPDEHEAGKTLESASFWRYGNIEFHFEQSQLTQIFTDYIDTLNGGKNIELKKWILDKPEKLTVEFVTQQLTKERIDYRIKHEKSEYTCQTSIWLINSNLHLNFQPLENENIDIDEWYGGIMQSINPNEYKLCSITLTEKEKLKTAYNNV